MPPLPPPAHLVSRALLAAVVLLLLAGGATLSSCRACKGSDPEPEPGVTAPGAISGRVDSGAVAPEGEGPWTLGLALFDEEALDPATLQALDEPELWTTFPVESLPAPFRVDIGAHFHGWIVVVLDEDSSGLPGTPVAGDLVGVHPTLVETPASDVTVYLEEIWER